MLFWKFIKGFGFTAIVIICSIIIYRFNKELFSLINGHQAGIGKYIFVWLTMIGDGSIILLAIFYIYTRASGFYRINPPLAAIGLFSYLVSGAIVQALKHYFEILRPAKVLGKTNIQILGPVLYKHSFPSGHSAAVFSLTALLILMSSSKKVKTFWLVLGTLVAGSRIVVGAHWPVDVFVGSVIGYSTTHIIYQSRDRLTGFYSNLYDNHFKAYINLRRFAYLLIIITALYLQSFDAMLPDLISHQIFFLSVPCILWGILGFFKDRHI